MIAMKLNDRQKGILRRAAAHPDGVANPAADISGFGRKNGYATMAVLKREGLIIPNAHGDWYITDAGRAAVDEILSAKETDQAAEIAFWKGRAIWWCAYAENGLRSQPDATDLKRAERIVEQERK